MKTQLNNHAGFVELSAKELSEVYGGSMGDFLYDVLYGVGFSLRVAYELIQDNIEHPIGSAGGYPPR